MAFAGKYRKIGENDHFQEGEDVDLEDNASDITKSSSTIEILNKTDFFPLRDDANVSTTSPAQRLAMKRANVSSNLWTWMRWAMIVGLQIILILLFSIKQGDYTKPTNDLQDLAAGGQFVETGSDINGLYKTRKYHLSRLHHESSQPNH
jgi:hypothetical protein